MPYYEVASLIILLVFSRTHITSEVKQYLNPAHWFWKILLTGSQNKIYKDCFDIYVSQTSQSNITKVSCSFTDKGAWSDIYWL